MQVLAFVCLLVLVALISAQDTSANQRRESSDSLSAQRPEEYEGFFRSFRSSAANGKPTFIRFGKRAQPSFIRFGKRAQPSFIRFGRAAMDY